MEAEDDTILGPRGNVLDTICCGLRGESGSQGEGGRGGGGRDELQHMIENKSE